MAPVGIGILGTGMIARYHAHAIAATPEARLVAVCREDATRAAQAEADFGVPCETSLQSFLTRQDLDAICICTPSGLHAQQTIAAAQAGKHVLVEKPLALNLADADAMLTACQNANVLLAVALQRRTDPQFIAIHEAIAAGELGRLVLGNVTIPYVRPQSYYDSADWRGTWALDGGGALMNQGVHLIDLLLWFMGDLAAVQAEAGTLAHEIEVEDCITAALRFQNGALGSIVATTAAAPGFPHRVEVYGTLGGVQIEGERILRWEGGGSQRSSTTDDIGPTAAGAGAKPTGISTVGHTLIMQDFVEAIQSGRPPLVPGEEGRRSLAAVLDIYAAAQRGQGSGSGD